MENSGKTFYYPNRMGRIIMLAAEEVLGANGINAVLNLGSLTELIGQYPPNNPRLEFPFSNVSRLHVALEDFYGPHGGRGVALRIGRASFQHMLREYGGMFGLNDLAFRLLPMRARLKLGMVLLADIFNKHSDQHVRVEEKEKEILWHIDRCPLCWERHDLHSNSEDAACQMAVGLLQEFLYWISGGKYYHVEEKKCIARGDKSCTIVIDKTPMS